MSIATTLITEVTDKTAITGFLIRNKPMNLYQLGDLDPFFFPKTKWFAAVRENTIMEMAMLYAGDKGRTLLAFSDNDSSLLASVIDASAEKMKGESFAHLSCGLAGELDRVMPVSYLGRHLKMTLNSGKLPHEPVREGTKRLGPDDRVKLFEFYEENYPGNYFDERMLSTGKYFGSFESNMLAGVAGIHVYSAEMRVAALGNIAVARNMRGNGIGRNLVICLCRDLLQTVDTIGLNVESTNQEAIRCYSGCGFSVSGEYDEYVIKVS